MNITYEKTFYGGKSLKAITKRFLKELPEDVNFLISTGSSGCAIASAMIVTADRHLRHCVIRKENEDSHSGLRGFGYPKKPVGAFVDDFISTGTTVKRVLEECEKRVRYIMVGTSKFSPEDNEATVRQIGNQYKTKVILIK